MNQEVQTIKQRFAKRNKVSKEKNRLFAYQKVLIPILAIFTGLVIGGVLIAVTTEEVYIAFRQGLWNGIQESWNVISLAYGALLTGSIGNIGEMISAVSSQNPTELQKAFNPILESLTTSIPYIFTGVAVALSFKAGVFNIGAEGQIFIGAIASGFVGYSLTGLPPFLHITLALLAGALGGGLWGFIPGWLKVKTGGSEVINTIMMNYIAFRLSEWLLSGPMKKPGVGNPISPTIQPTAMFPRLFPDPIRFHIGFFIAIGLVALVTWIMNQTTWGLGLNIVGTNPKAAKYAGINISRYTIMSMVVSGALAGIAGTNEVLGVNHNVAMAFSSGYGFDAIALALLGNNHPVGVLFAALLFGTLRSGATNMQIVSGTPIDIIAILQAVILIFIAAPEIIRKLYRIPESRSEVNETNSKAGEEVNK